MARVDPEQPLEIGLCLGRRPTDEVVITCIVQECLGRRSLRHGCPIVPLRLVALSFSIQLRGLVQRLRLATRGRGKY